MNTVRSWARISNKLPSYSRFHSTSTPVRVRYAPSPTGYLHLGGVRTALLNFLFARANAGTFVLRIEDTDQTREVPGAADQLEVDLDWLGLIPDESPQRGGAYGPYKQSQRRSHYLHYSQQLLDSGHAYRCFCSKQRLASLAHGYDGRCRNLDPAAIAKNLATDIPHSIRMKIPSGQTTVEDLVYGQVTFDNSTIDEQILLKSDGFPTYHLANVRSHFPETFIFSSSDDQHNHMSGLLSK
jgi:glutamyl-tRNA synthetase